MHPKFNLYQPVTILSTFKATAPLSKACRLNTPQNVPKTYTQMTMQSKSLVNRSVETHGKQKVVQKTGVLNSKNKGFQSVIFMIPYGTCKNFPTVIYTPMFSCQVISHLGSIVEIKGNF